MSTLYIDEFASNLQASPIIAILRCVTPQTVAGVAEQLTNGGIRFLEVTLNSPDALESIHILSSIYGNNGIFIGAGTVLNATQVAAVAEAGGQYIISPNTNTEVIRQTKHLGLVSIPGFYTPTEAFVAIDAGADYLKLFPARNLGPKYISDIKAVFTKPIIAVGGIDLDNMREFLKVSAGVGVGSNLYSPMKSCDELLQAAQEYCSRLR